MNAVGKKGEDVISLWLIKHGYSILERNWKVQTGEIDIIAIEKEVLVFIEVKTLLNTTLESLDIIVGRRKQIKISQTAKYFLKSHRQYHKLAMRFDVVVLRSNPFNLEHPKVLHIKNAFGDCND
ncbi:MAG: YraN family protein [Treponema sp.]